MHLRDRRTRNQKCRERFRASLPLQEALALARAWAGLPRHYREPIRSWIIMASIHDNLPEELKQLPPNAQGLERRKHKR